MKFTTWNVAGLRSCVKKGGRNTFSCYTRHHDSFPSGAEFPLHEMPDVLCLQETKATEDELPEEILLQEYPHRYWFAAEKDGYSGVG